MGDFGGIILYKKTAFSIEEGNIIQEIDRNMFFQTIMRSNLEKKILAIIVLKFAFPSVF